MIIPLWPSCLPKRDRPCLVRLLFYCFKPFPFLFLSAVPFYHERPIDFYFIHYGQLALRPTYSLVPLSNIHAHKDINNTIVYIIIYYITYIYVYHIIYINICIILFATLSIKTNINSSKDSQNDYEKTLKIVYD